MPRIADGNTEEMLALGKAGFHFSAIRPERLGATEYTLVTLAVDLSGSVDGFKDALLNSVRMMYESCKKSPRVNNLLVRAIGFSDRFQGGIEEIHGFKPLAEIDPATIQLPDTGGGTPLVDAAYNASAATNDYAKQLSDQEFLVNSIVVVVTDGLDNASAFTPSKVKKVIHEGVSQEYLESALAILIGVNTTQCATELAAFKDEAGFDHYIDVGDATPGKLAKMAAFVSHSVSSQSQALGTGGKSQAIPATI